MDPDALIVVAARRSPDRRPAAAAVLGAPHDDRRTIDHVLIFWVDDDGWQVAAADAAQWPRVTRRGRGIAERRGGSGDARAQRPMRAAVAGLVEAHRSRSPRGI